MSTHFRPRAYYASAPPSPVRPGSSRQTIRAITPSPSQSLSDETGKGCAGLETADGQQAALEQQDVPSKSEEVDESKQYGKVTNVKGSLLPKEDKAPLNSTPVRQKFWAKNQRHRRTRTHSMPTSPHHVMSNADQTDKDGAMSHEDDEAHHHHDGKGLHAECPDTPTPMSSSQCKFAYLPLGMPIPYSHCPHQRFLGTKSDTFTTPTTPDITRAEHNSPTTPSTTHDTTSTSSASASAHNANFHCAEAAAEKQASSSCNIHSLDFSFGGAAPPPHQGSWAGGGAGVGPRALDTKVGTWSAKKHTQSTLETTQHHGAGSAAAHAHTHAHAAQPAHHYNITTSHHQHNQHYDNANVVLASPRLENPSVTLPLSSSFPSSISTSASISSGITAAAHPTSLDAATMQSYSLFPHQPHTARIFAPALAPLNTFQHDQHALSQPPSQHAHAQTYQKLSSPASTSSSSSSSSYSASPTGFGRHTCSSRVSNASAGTAASRRSVFSTPGRDELERKKPLVEADDGPFGTVACMEDLEARRRGIGSRMGSSHGKKVEGDEGAKKKRFWACGVRMKLKLKRGCGVM